MVVSANRAESVTAHIVRDGVMAIDSSANQREDHLARRVRGWWAIWTLMPLRGSSGDYPGPPAKLTDDRYYAAGQHRDGSTKASGCPELGEA